MASVSNLNSVYCNASHLPEQSDGFIIVRAHTYDMASKQSQGDVVSQGLNNLQSIQNGEDPRAHDDSETVESDSITVLDESELPYTLSGIVRTRDEIIDDFVRAVNIVEPEHPYENDPYPITRDDLELSYCQTSSSYWARCGPRSRSNTIYFAVDRKRVGRMDRERYYNVLVHELTHVTEGSHTQGSPHNPTFWRQMADNAVRFAKGWQNGPIDLDKFVSYCRYEPNRPMTDRRMRTVEEQQQDVEDRMLSRL
jgi:hypothetical protein